MKAISKSSKKSKMNVKIMVSTRAFWLIPKFLVFLSLFISSSDLICLHEDPRELDNYPIILNEDLKIDKETSKDSTITVKPIDYLQVFNDDLKRYKPNAPWITETFMNMNFQQFSIAFKRIVKILTVPQERWFYFSDTPHDFDVEYYWPECLWQCIYYEQWMSRLSLDKNQLVYKDANHTKIPFVNILMTLEDLECGKNLVDKYYQFYAFYTDCLSHFFCRAVYSCYETINDVNAYKLSLTTAKKSLSKMKQNLIILRKSKSFYPTYKMTLDNYKNILALLEAEKIKTYAG